MCCSLPRSILPGNTFCPAVNLRSCRRNLVLATQLRRLPADVLVTMKHEYGSKRAAHPSPPALPSPSRRLRACASSALPIALPRRRPVLRVLHMPSNLASCRSRGRIGRRSTHSPALPSRNMLSATFSATVPMTTCPVPSSAASRSKERRPREAQACVGGSRARVLRRPPPWMSTAIHTRNVPRMLAPAPPGAQSRGGVLSRAFAAGLIGAVRALRQAVVLFWRGGHVKARAHLAYNVGRNAYPRAAGARAQERPCSAAHI